MRDGKVLVWLSGEVKTPPFTRAARVEAGCLLRRLQEGEVLGMPHSRAMTDVGAGCHEVRVPDRDQTWRIMYAIEPDAIVILAVFGKKTRTTPKTMVTMCRSRLDRYLRAAKGKP